MYVSLKTTLNGSLKMQIIIEQKVTHRKELLYYVSKRKAGDFKTMKLLVPT